MNDASVALAALKAHFSQVSREDYVDDLRRHSPELLEGGAVVEDRELAQLGLPGLETEETSAMLLFRGQPERLPLNAYLASALTGLTDEQRQLIFQLSDSVAQVATSLSIDLYEPRKQTDPVHHPDVADSQVFHIDRERVLGSDLLIYLAHFPSTGAGEELDFAYNAMVPIVVVTHSTSRVSRMVTGIPGLVVTVSYDEPEELRSRLLETLLQLRPQLVQRKLSFSEYDANMVGNRVRELREAQGLTRDDVARASSTRFPISVDWLARLEESTDKDSNPSLIQLREIATALRTTVSDLVEPDNEEMILATLSSWVADHRAARFGDINTKDRNKLLRRLLLRLIDNLEDE